MKRFLISAVAAVTMTAAFVPAAHALTANSTFTVSVALSARCAATNSGTTTLNFGTYTALTGAATPAPTVDLSFDCTRGLAAPTFAFDVPAFGAANGDGILAGLNYTMGIALQASTPGTDATVGGAGTAATRTYRVTGGMAANQAGQCATGLSTAANCDAAAQTHTRTLIITY